MRYYAVFYISTESGYRNPCGDRSLIIIDGRLKFFRVMNIARETCSERGFDCFSIQRAGSLRDVNTDDNPLINLYKAAS
jgi:hypothetical protein